MLCLMTFRASSCHGKQTTNPAATTTETATTSCPISSGHLRAILTICARMLATGAPRHRPHLLPLAWTEVPSAREPAPKEAALPLAVEVETAFQPSVSQKLHGAESTGARIWNRAKETPLLEKSTRLSAILAARIAATPPRARITRARFSMLLKSRCDHNPERVESRPRRTRGLPTMPDGAASQRGIIDSSALRSMPRWAARYSTRWVPRAPCRRLEVSDPATVPAGTRTSSARVPTQHVPKLHSIRDPVPRWLAISNAPVSNRVNRNAHCSRILWSGYGSLHGVRNATAKRTVDEAPCSAQNAISMYPTPGRMMVSLTT